MLELDLWHRPPRRCLHDRNIYELPLNIKNYMCTVQIDVLSTNYIDKCQELMQMIIMNSSSLFFLETLLQKTLNVSSKEKSIKQKKLQSDFQSVGGIGKRRSNYIRPYLLFWILIYRMHTIAPSVFTSGVIFSKIIWVKIC